MFSLEAEERLQKQLLDDVMTEALHKEKNVVRPPVVFTVKRSISLCVAEGIFSYQNLNIHGQWIFFKHVTLLIKVTILHDRDLQEEPRSQSSFF